ncbi:hypothetical protein BDN70DRAFT_871739 [Pholiota conissans]|uniref:Uncharacterized protein n=1 Tax=Pholiota conissans TaxID=109636 RepID=A0A9P5ZCR6_9AGAR|nr:hypothetical protein BDN70DRAFT_871739 [Pholiota conissans]
MDLNLQRAPTFPPELIEMVVDYLVPNSYDEPLDRLQRRDLASCGLASTSFYLPSRKHLFANVKIDYDPDQGRQPPYELDDILFANPVLQRHVRHLVIVVGSSSRWDPDWPYWRPQIKTCLPDFMRFIPALRMLSIETEYRQNIGANENIAFIMEHLRLLCPSLNHLRLSNLIFPVRFILKWDKVTDLELHGIGIEEPDSDDESNTDISDTTYSVTPAPSFLRLTVGKGVYYHEILQDALYWTHLQYLHLSPKLFEDDRGWALLDNTLPTLRHLSLYCGFMAPWHLQYTLCDNKFPALENIEIVEQVDFNEPFPYVVDALAPKEGKFSIRFIKITFEDDHTLEPLDLLKWQNHRWAKIDAAWTSSQYCNLEKIYIHRTFRFASLEPDTDEGMMDLAEDCSIHLLPLVSSSSIDLEFSLKFCFDSVVFNWNNCTGLTKTIPPVIH